MKHYGDITKINGAEVEPVWILTGGSPCQDLSVAGLRKGLQHSALGDGETTRSGLFMEQIRIVKEMRENDKANITATAVSVETLAEATDAFRKAGRECSITQIAVTRMKKVGSYTMPDAMNPVWIISGGKKCSE